MQVLRILVDTLLVVLGVALAVALGIVGILALCIPTGLGWAYGTSADGADGRPSSSSG